MTQEYSLTQDKKVSRHKDKVIADYDQELKSLWLSQHEAESKRSNLHCRSWESK